MMARHSPLFHQPSTASSRIGSAIGWTALLGYLGWNSYWLFNGRLPPGLFHYFTGLPSPTTGLTRSLRAALAGDWSASLFWNPFTLPLLLLFALTFCVGLYHRLQDRPLLSRHWLFAWILILAAAWATKFWTGPTTW